MVRRRFRARFAAEGTRRTGETIVGKGATGLNYVTSGQLKSDKKRKEINTRSAIESAYRLNVRSSAHDDRCGAPATQMYSVGLGFPAAD